MFGKHPVAFFAISIIICCQVNAIVFLPFISLLATGLDLFFMIYDQYQQMHNLLTVDSGTYTPQEFVDKIGMDFAHIHASIDVLQHDTSDIINAKQNLYEFYQTMSAVNNMFKKSRKYLANETLYSRKTLERFSEDVLDYSAGLAAQLRGTHNKLVRHNQNNIVLQLKKYINYFVPFCKRIESRQQYFYNLFLFIITHELRGLATMNYAYRISQIRYNETMEDVATDTKDESFMRISNTIEFFKQIVKSGSRAIYRCDLGSEYVEDDSYITLRSVFQRVIYHADTLNKFDRELKLGFIPWDPICPYKYVTKCSQAKCQFDPCQCKHVKACSPIVEKNVYTCTVQDNCLERRYLYVGSTQDSCYAGGKYQIINSGVRCNCICDDVLPNSDRYFSLEQITSYVKRNYVVTGVRFVKKNHTLFIQIQQGRLLDFGFIDVTTVHWKPINNPSILYNHSANVSPKNIKRHVLSWKYNQTLFLDQIKSPMDHVVTGVKFSVESESKNKVKNLKLKIQSTPFNLTTGELFRNKSFWHSSLDTVNRRIERDVSNFDAPVNIDTKHKLDHERYKKIAFVPTGLYSKDYGTTTIPYFDSQDVAPQQPVPLDGVSLDLLSGEKSGGFIVLKISTYDVSPLFEQTDYWLNQNL